MRFLHIISSVRPEFGGPAEGLRRIIDGYLEDGHTAEVLTFDEPDAALAKEFPVPVHAIGPVGTKYGYNRRATSWLVANRSRFDGVLVHGAWQYQGLAALRTVKAPQRYAVFTHGMLDPWFNRKYPAKYVKKLVYWFAVERNVLRNAYRVLFTSETERDLAGVSFPFTRWKEQVIPYGTAGPPKQAEEQREAFFRACPELRGKPFLLFAGRIHEKKGCDLLLEAYGRAHQTLSLPDLVIAGPDQTGLKATLQARANELGIAANLHWPGMLAGDAKWGAFRACEAFVLPSHQENFGIAVAEALSCGKPVLISDQVNICDQIRKDCSGVIAPDTLEGTYSLLDQWAVMPEEERQRMGENALRSFQLRYDTRQTARAIATLFETSSMEAEPRQRQTAE